MYIYIQVQNVKHKNLNWIYSGSTSSQEACSKYYLIQQTTNYAIIHKKSSVIYIAD